VCKSLYLFGFKLIVDENLGEGLLVRVTFILYGLELDDVIQDTFAYHKDIFRYEKVFNAFLDVFFDTRRIGVQH